MPEGNIILCFRLYYTIGILENHICRQLREAVSRTEEGCLVYGDRRAGVGRGHWKHYKKWGELGALWLLELSYCKFFFSC